MVCKGYESLHRFFTRLSLRQVLIVSQGCQSLHKLFTQLHSLINSNQIIKCIFYYSIEQPEYKYLLDVASVSYSTFIFSMTRAIF